MAFVIHRDGSHCVYILFCQPPHGQSWFVDYPADGVFFLLCPQLFINIFSSEAVIYDEQVAIEKRGLHQVNTSSFVKYMFLISICGLDFQFFYIICWYLLSQWELSLDIFYFSLAFSVLSSLYKAHLYDSQSTHFPLLLQLWG